MKIELGKSYRTRDGREVRIYAVDGGGKDHIHGAVKSECGSWVAEQWFAGGKYAFCGTHMKDLVEVRPRIKREVWVNLYQNGETTWPCRMSADECASGDRIACVRVEIDVEEGHGL